MDLELDLLTEETFCKKMAEYLSGDLFRVVHLVSLDYIDKYEEEPVVQEVLEEADLVLPGEKAILSLYHVDVLETGGMVVDYRIAHRLLKKDLLKGKKCFLVLRSKKEAKIVYRYLKSAYENLDIVGVYSMDTGVTEEALVNEINTKVPDLILMAMENHEAESFLKHKHHMINAKMGVVLSGVMDMILRENIHVPNVIKNCILVKFIPRPRGFRIRCVGADEYSGRKWTTIIPKSSWSSPMPKRSCPRMKNTTNNKWWMTYLLLTAGTFFMAVGINVIYEPLSMVTGGFSGIGILVKKLTQTARWSGIPVGMTTLLLNIPLFIWGYSQKGKVFVKKTVYAASCFSFFLLIIPTFDIVKQDYLMAALVGGLLNGTGIGLVFSQGASTGGSDLLSVLTAKILPGLSASERLILIDTLIVAAGVFIFGLEIGLYAVVAVFVTGKVSNAILDGLKFAKIAYIISDHPEEISEHILRELGRGLTGLEGQGMYSEKHKMVLMCVVSKKEAVLLKDIVKNADNEAFLILSEAKEVLGEGFWREMQ